VFAAYSAAPVHRTTTVPLRRLDDLLHPRSCTERVFVKLDVEGSELALLRGAARLLREASPALLVEINPRAMSAAGTSPEALRRLLLDAGYDRLAIPSGPRQRLPLADVPFDATQGDVVVLHERGAWS
jgi:hypothetical protein